MLLLKGQESDVHFQPFLSKRIAYQHFARSSQVVSVGDRNKGDTFQFQTSV